MAALLGVIFSRHHPVPPTHTHPSPGLPGQASLLQVAPGAPRSSLSTLVDELESSLEDVGELRHVLQRKEALVQKRVSKLPRWQQVLEDISAQHKKPADVPQGSLAYLEQANIPASMKQT
uniref:Mediator of RNA polymerase II transcription subunit 28 n=1 Tax=Rhinolophus ferrumequinum TaxID=59479 RepID=A0A671EJV7_RHIFE